MDVRKMYYINFILFCLRPKYLIFTCYLLCAARDEHEQEQSADAGGSPHPQVHPHLQAHASTNDV